MADEIICLETLYPLYAVGQWSCDFTQVSEAEVSLLLARAHKSVTLTTSDNPPGDRVEPPARDEEVFVPTEAARLTGH